MRCFGRTMWIWMAAAGLVVPAAAAAAAAGSGGGLTPYAMPVFGEKAWVTNSMLVTWLVAAGIILLAQRATRRMAPVPEGLQNLWEWMVESLYDFLEGIIGGDLTKRTFWFFATVFLFILAANWFGLIPGVGTIGWGVPDATGHLHHISLPLLRGVNADLNMTFAIAMIFFALWLYWALRVNGVRGVLLHLFGPKGNMTGLLRWVMIAVFLVVGLLEVVTILFRPVTLSFRLYGNIFAGENMLEAMASLVQQPAWLRILASVVVPVPFYFLEVLVGLVQALVFMLLTAVFTLLICTHEEGAEGASH
ncbi:MAG TPA: F0F1 ATP synthase subunit A [Verrucomicrobiota bacterium]|nr:F0F1 ATP synthase subunit A [Verrucomicrobiota bacterium]HNU49842.1 F0F1 ATP synthase subunit A [Verrucomicrobiota bacterium]